MSCLIIHSLISISTLLKLSAVAIMSIQTWVSFGVFSNPQYSIKYELVQIFDGLCLHPVYTLDTFTQHTHSQCENDLHTVLMETTFNMKSISVREKTFQTEER